MTSASILVGTCSWTDKTLVEQTDWYPKRSMSAEARLRYYAEHFSIAEADGTYYFPPTPAMCRAWAERTPATFTMNVKAYSLLTGHPTKPASLWADVRAELQPEMAAKRNVYAHHLSPDALDEAWHRFADALEPLRHAGKLGAVLLQYPPWFTPKHANREVLRAVRERLPDLPFCVELRSPGWLAPADRERTLALLRDLGLSMVIVDAPRASKLRTVVQVTTPHLAVVRFHGRADDTWSTRTETAAERFRYEYSTRQLRAWVPKLQQLAGEADTVHALMNNCYRDFGVHNAAQLAGMVAN